MKKFCLALLFLGVINLSPVFSATFSPGTDVEAVLQAAEKQCCYSYEDLMERYDSGLVEIIEETDDRLIVNVQTNGGIVTIAILESF